MSFLGLGSQGGQSPALDSQEREEGQSRQGSSFVPRVTPLRLRTPLWSDCYNQSCAQRDGFLPKSQGRVLSKLELKTR